MLIVILVLLGLIFGSFVNALVWRIHKKKDWVKERSVCTHCGHELAAKDLIPVLSWIMLKGKCRYCHKAISWQYPLVEALTAFLYVFSYIYWPHAFNAQNTVLFGFWLVFLTGFMALAVYDIRWQILPDKIVFTLIGFSLIQAGILLLYGPFGTALWALVVSAAIGGGIFYLIFQISQGKWIGGGDVKLGFLLGLVLADGWLMALALFMASVLGTIFALPLFLTGRANRKSKIPFGPFLILGAIIARLFGAALLNWYKTKFIL